MERKQSWATGYVLLGGLLLVLCTSVGCASCSAEPSGDETSGDRDASTASDATADARDGQSQSGDDATPGDTSINDATDTASRVDDECPAYQRLCDGECIPASNDPDNCGACGNTCGAQEVCSGGRCVEECMSGLTACERSCVDVKTDNEHCGGCGITCGAGEGCVAGQCHPTLVDYDEPDECADGGPPIDVGNSVDSERSCSGRMAELTFRWALCSCDQISINNDFVADAYDSTLGPYVPGGHGGGVGTNGAFSIINRANITGTLWAAGQNGVSINDAATIGQRLHVGGQTNIGGTEVGSDAFVEGPFGAGSSAQINGTLHVPQGVDVPQNVSYGDLQRQDVDVAPACGECEPGDRVPIADIVADHRTNNDNARIGLDAGALDQPATSSPIRLDLPCGEYYLSGINTNSRLAIVAHGNTALYIDGDVRPQNEFSITVAPGGQLDVFITGDVVTSNQVSIGSPNHPALMRMYIGGDNGLIINNRLRAGAFIYTVPGTISNNNRTEVFGGAYVQNFVSNGDAQFHFDRRVTTVGDDCEEPDPDPTPNPDAGTPDTGDAHDAGDTGGGGEPVCGTQDDTCGADSDCCSPLVCRSGQCTLLECSPMHETCQTSSDCCSQLQCAAGYCAEG